MRVFVFAETTLQEDRNETNCGYSVENCGKSFFKPKIRTIKLKPKKVYKLTSYWVTVSEVN